MRKGKTEKLIIKVSTPLSNHFV